MKNYIITVLLLIFSIKLNANWGGGTINGAIYTGNFEAMGTSNIQITDELLNIDLYNHSARVNVRYKFKNSGNAVSIKAGFPVKYVNDVIDYKITAGGKPVKYHLLKDGEYDPSYEYEAYDGNVIKGWLVSEMEFASNEIKTVNISYTSYYQFDTGGVSDDDAMSDYIFTYLLSTGSVWKGPIENGKIVIETRNISKKAFSVSSGQYSLSGTCYVRNFKNLEPSVEDDIQIKFKDRISIYASYGENSRSSIFKIADKLYYMKKIDSVSASSVLQGNYAAENVAYSYDTYQNAWVEGKKGDGKNEYIELNFDVPSEISLLAVMPGYFKNRDIYYKNNRVKKARITVNGSWSKEVIFYDEFAFPNSNLKAYQYIDLTGYKGKIKKVRLTILEVYKGNKYDDTCISGIAVFQKPEKPVESYGSR